MVNEGSPYTLTLGPVQDVAADTVSEYRIVWGDETTPGSYQSISAAQLALNGESFHRVNFDHQDAHRPDLLRRSATCRTRRTTAWDRNLD